MKFLIPFQSDQWGSIVQILLQHQLDSLALSYYLLRIT